MVAGYYHDHVFVQAEMAEVAWALLQQLGRREELSII